MLGNIWKHLSFYFFLSFCFLVFFLFLFIIFAWNTFLCLDRNALLNIQAIRQAAYSNLIQAWNISLNFSLHRYKIFQWSQNYLVDFEAEAIKKCHYFPTGCSSTYFHIPRGTCTLSGTLKWNWRAGETRSIFIIPSRIWNNSAWSLKKPNAFPSTFISLSCCCLLS